MEGKGCLRRLKQFDGWTWLTPTPHFMTALCHCLL